MRPNPVLKKLGFSDSDRLVIIHTDDIGMCHASVQAFIDLWENGTISSGAIMMPCPWSGLAAEYCRVHPGVDMGVHATLTSEWNTYRWHPLSTLDPSSGMVDEDGFFWRTSAEAQERGDPEAVLVELSCQVRKALDWGVDVTHVDTHMGTVAHQKFIPAYLYATTQYHIPVMVPRGDVSYYERLGLDGDAANQMASFIQTLEDQGIPLIDNLIGVPLDQPEDQLGFIKRQFANFPPGITHFIIHPSIDTPELRAICPDWQSRVANYSTFMGKELKNFLQNSGIHIIGYRDLKRIMPR